MECRTFFPAETLELVEAQVRLTIYRAGSPGGTEGASVVRLVVVIVLRRLSLRGSIPRRKPLSSHIRCGSS